MPIYVYRCRSCKHEFERKQAWGEEPVTECPECQGILIRIPQAVATVWKGGAPSEKIRMQRRGNHSVPIEQTEEGHWQQKGLV